MENNMEDNNILFTKIYGWMFVGLLISFITGKIAFKNDISIYEKLRNINIAYNPFEFLLIFLGLGFSSFIPFWKKNYMRTKMPVVITFFSLNSIVIGLIMSDAIRLCGLELVMKKTTISVLIVIVSSIIGFFVNFSKKTSFDSLMITITALIVPYAFLSGENHRSIFMEIPIIRVIVTIIEMIMIALIIILVTNKIKNYISLENENKTSIIYAHKLYIIIVLVFGLLIRLYYL